MKKFLIKRTNITADRDIMFIGKRGICGESAEPYETYNSARAALKRQRDQDMKYCPECVIQYEIAEKMEV